MRLTRDARGTVTDAQFSNTFCNVSSTAGVTIVADTAAIFRSLIEKVACNWSRSTDTRNLHLKEAPSNARRSIQFNNALERSTGVRFLLNTFHV